MDCLTLPEIDLSEWGAALKEQMKGERYPLIGMFELTDRCNLGCVHCFINQPAASPATRTGELTTSQVKTVLDQVAAAGCLFLTFTGGEILLRSDFEEIYRYSRQKGILINLFSNGTLVTPRIADLLADIRPQSIEITMYGATRETYEKVTGVHGSYDQFRRGIDLLKEYALPVSVKTFLITVNFHEFTALRTLAEDLGMKFRYDGLTWPRFDGSSNPRNYQVPSRELVSLDDEDPERAKEWQRIGAQFSGKLYRAEYVYNCGAGLHSFHIDSQARMNICTMTRQPSYNILEIGFQPAWEKIGELRQLKRQQDTICRSCTLGGLCSQCPGWSQAVHGDNETPVDFVCELAHLRAKQVNGV